MRVRITMFAVLVVGLALAAGSLILIHQLRVELTDGLRNAAELRADSLAAGLADGSGPADRLSASEADDDDEVVQVLDTQGRVAAASANIAGLPRLEVSDEVAVVDGDPYVVEDSDASTPDGDRVVVVGTSREETDDAVASVRRLLVTGLPVMLLVVGTVTWLVVGRALGPVERIRREADEIGVSAMHRRLPEPRRHDEIGRLTDTMNRMLDRLDHGQRQQRQFVSDAAHELRSPIASIKQNVEVATGYPDRLSTDELVAVVGSETSRLERLVVSLLSLARLDEHSRDRTCAPADLDDLVLAEASRLRQETHLDLDTARVSAGQVRGDPALLHQLLRNLLDNAQRHAVETIALTLAEAGPTVVLTVEDDGPGIPLADRRRVFERFVRLDEARARDDGGSGLGLAIVDTIATAYDGTVTIGSSDLGGARVTVVLPRLDEPGAVDSFCSS